MDSASYNQKDIIDAVIASLFRKGNYDETRGKLTPYISEKVLWRQQAKAMLSRGDIAKLPNLQEILSTEELKQMRESKELTFTGENRLQYKVKDKVELKLRARNVREIEIKIYPIDL